MDVCVFLFLLLGQSAGLSRRVRVYVVTVTYRHTDRRDGRSARCILGKVWQVHSLTQVDLKGLGLGWVVLWCRLNSGSQILLKNT